MGTRVGGAPRGPPPTMAKPGGAPKGAPPTGGRPTRQKTTKGKDAGKTNASAAVSNTNVPKAPPVAHFICYIKGEPFSTATEIPPVDDDLDLDAAADIANMSAIVDGLGGNDAEPFKVDEPEKPAAGPPAGGGGDINNPSDLALMLQA